MHDHQVKINVCVAMPRPLGPVLAYAFQFRRGTEDPDFDLVALEWLHEMSLCRLVIGLGDGTSRLLFVSAAPLDCSVR